MTDHRRSAYELPFERVELTPEEQRLALLWWQRGEDYHPLCCPVCGATLEVTSDKPALRCPTNWCSYVTSEIPWGIYVAWRKFSETKKT